MAALIGIVLAAIVGAFARVVGFDRDRAFYPLVLMVVASYYVLFAAMAGSTAELLTEMVFFALFAAAAVFGFRSSLWLVVAGLALHGLFDFVRHWLLEGQGIPLWWPAFCLAYDLTAAIGLSLLLLLRQSGPDQPRT